ncbi:hypothetical protein QFC20_003543 [Naganishia adeliensis]|uniref:Uncharacterized protein n=1 Tax=Naganishia adeliensis TaxID=92952 RepID=A0ACC2WAU3_9TREE|nr:hypothetical protein QFC20_003543 [Naganishia adeliensis]
MPFDLLDIMMSVQFVRAITDNSYFHGRFRLHINRESKRNEVHADDRTIRNAFEHQDPLIEPMSLVMIPSLMPFFTIRLILTPQQDAPNDDFISRLSVDLLVWESQVALLYCRANGHPQESRISPKSFEITVVGALYSQAVAFGRTVNVAYTFREAFGFFVLSVHTRTYITPDQAKDLARIMEQNFFKTCPSFLNKPAGHVAIVEGLKAARKIKEQQGVKAVSATIAYRRLGDETRPIMEAKRFIERGGRLPRLDESLLLDRNQGDDEHDKDSEALEELYAKLTLFAA